jgi:SagB-type dehydrogenase family enzyme
MEQIELPGPVLKGMLSVEEAIGRRRSRRSFSEAPLTLEQLGQLLWAAQGVTGETPRHRAAPSAGATCPMEIFVATGAATVGQLQAGVYHYLPARHALEQTHDADIRERVAEAALGQDFLEAAPASVLMAADHERTGRRYGERARRYVAMEAGHISQNVYLQAEAIGLATVAVGAFHDRALASAFQLPRPLEALYLMAVGYAAES